MSTLEAPARARRLRLPLASTGALALASLALRVRDPHSPGSWGFCPSALLGIWCPGCGGLRAVNDLTHGDVAAAASSNLALVVLVPVVALGLGILLVDAWTGRRPRALAPTPRRVALAVTLLVLLAAFTVLRNTSTGAWLAP